MVNYKRIRWYLDQQNGLLLDGKGRPVVALNVNRGDVYAIELQVFKGGFLAIDADGLIDADIAVDLTGFVSVLLGLKSPAHYFADGPFDIVAAGFDSENPVYNLARGGVAMLALFDGVTPGDFYIELELRTATGLPLTVTHQPTVCHLLRDVVVGTEANMPDGVTAVISGNATISGANTSVDVSVAGMTSGGQVIIGMLAPTGEPTEPTRWETYAAGKFTINVSAAPGVGNAYNFRWTLVRKS